MWYVCVCIACMCCYILCISHAYRAYVVHIVCIFCLKICKAVDTYTIHTIHTDTCKYALKYIHHTYTYEFKYMHIHAVCTRCSLNAYVYVWYVSCMYFLSIHMCMYCMYCIYVPVCCMYRTYWPRQARMPAQRPPKASSWGGTQRAPLRASLARWPTTFFRHWGHNPAPDFAHPRTQHALGGSKVHPQRRQYAFHTHFALCEPAPSPVPDDLGR